MYESFLGLPRRSRSLEEFLSYFRFSSLEESFRRKGMGAMACAVLSAEPRENTEEKVHSVEGAARCAVASDRGGGHPASTWAGQGGGELPE
eukprot:g27162.t1